MYLFLVVLLPYSNEGASTGVKLQILHCKYCVFKGRRLISGVVLQSWVLYSNSIHISKTIFLQSNFTVVKKCGLTQGWLDWSSVHLAKKTAEAAIKDGMSLRKLYSTTVNTAT